MKPPIFDYAAPTTLEEAVSLLQAHDGEAKILSGGQSLMPLLNMRLARPELLIDLAKVPGLDYVRDDGGALAVGAMTRQRTVELSDLVRSKHTLVHAATLHIAHPQNRNQGTVGGSLAHADPAAEYPAVALALGARFRASGPNGSREISADDFFVTYLTTSLDPNEVLAEVSFPALPANAGWSFVEVARRHGDFAMAGVVATMTVAAGKCDDARVVLFGVGATPVRARQAEQMLRGEKPTESLFENAGRKASEEIDEPLSDVHATAEYRRDLARVLTRRALLEAAGRAGHVP
jgi:carbon-monoxide dehydrogenase medium subunit